MEKWLSHLSLRYWTGEGGNKLGIDRIDVNPCICGQIDYLGNKGLVLEARYGGALAPVLSWRMNQAANPMRRKLQIYLECQCGKGVQAQLRICCWQQGAIAGFMQTLTVPLPMEKPYELDREKGSYLSLELWAGGEGRLEVGTMHFRESRDGAGSFFPGGVRHADAKGEEFFSYLDLMDCRPPLCVYFSGHRNQEGFEGGRMMQKMGAPFLLMSDPRLEGGAFYIGSEEYEVKLEETIREALNRLGFTSEQLILSGISMGSYGAVYYGARLMPHAILMGKPLMNAGTVAAVQRTVRPDAFGTSMDVLLKMEGRTDEVGINRLNQRMWQHFDTGDFTRTKFAVAYMQQDDYDPSAYEDLLEHLQGQQGAESCIYGKGFPGDTMTIQTALCNGFSHNTGEFCGKIMEDRVYLTYWDHNGADTFLCGSTLRFHENRAVEYENSCMNAGVTLRTWYSQVNYQDKRLEPQLPIPESGCRYELHPVLCCEPAGESFCA